MAGVVLSPVAWSPSTRHGKGGGGYVVPGMQNWKDGGGVDRSASSSWWKKEGGYEIAYEATQMYSF
ncbi:hypothetical protein IscW_ISCW011753 [Ixodes scapularis]|uniref:Uncharacterized protein n=1 Tax=Ixodes scapularis TaxID=6945 RepID=B7Q6W3_IXOSC|nr:hypothetical protein IscW_ISCW011753 [Ixodes scapularis]|eukprot:XP_002412044.1 hypothetical protein IscW_ISCW011753 [Ixodes scapularis]